VGYLLSIVVVVVVRVMNEYGRFLCKEAMGIFSEAEHQTSSQKINWNSEMRAIHPSLSPS
jgi:hypothetical protein